MVQVHRLLFTACWLTPRAQRAGLLTASESRAAKREVTRQLGVHMRNLKSFQSHPPAEACALAQQELDDIGSAGLPVTADAHNAAITLCGQDLPAAEALFARLARRGEPNEGSYTALLRALVASGSLDRALETLDQMLASGRVDPRLRTCAPLVHALCAEERQEDALSLWTRLRARGIVFSPDEHLALMHMFSRCAAPQRMLHILGELLELHPAPDGETARAIEAACRGLRASPPLIESVQIGADGCCPRCSGRLQLGRLSAPQKAALRSRILERVDERVPQRARHLRAFASWLGDRPPFDYVLDGPNIAYANQNFEGGAFSFKQLDTVVRTLRERGMRTLLLLPSRYVADEIPNHTCSSEKTSRLSDSDRASIAEWRANGVLYECARGLYDDWFWMYASVADDGAQTKVVTNDGMRDHHVGLLEPREFDRWRESQIVDFSFEFSGWRDDGDAAAELPQVVSVSIDEPPTFSNVAQVQDGHWHVPVPRPEGGEDLQPNEWLCIACSGAGGLEG